MLTPVTAIRFDRPMDGRAKAVAFVGRLKYVFFCN